MRTHRLTTQACCTWANAVQKMTPSEVATTFPTVMRPVLASFGLRGADADAFLEDACAGNWERLHTTHAEDLLTARQIADRLADEVYYCSDRWSWDRLIRTQWLYQRLCERIRRQDLLDEPLTVTAATPPRYRP